MMGLRASCIFALLVSFGLAGCFGTAQQGDDSDALQDADPSGSPVREIDLTIVAIRCPAGYDNGQADDICLAYDGQVPGPTWVFEVGDRVNITLHNEVAESLAALGAGEEPIAAELAEARYSLHRHGISQDACSDGVAQPVGTLVCDSTVGPGGSVTYTFDTIFPGFWHYHDHAHSFSVAPAVGPSIGGQAAERGLWGSFIVLPPGETTDHVFDLHLMDGGANGGLGLDVAARSGERFDLDVVGLGFLHRFFEVRLEDPEGNAVGEVLVGPGVSRGITVHEAKPGTYTWRAEGVTVSRPYDLQPSAPPTYTGTIRVTGSEATGSEGEGPGAGGDVVVPTTLQPDRVFVVPFNHLDAMARAETTGSMGLPLLEANVGEVLEFQVVNTDVVPHVFHLHGHSWPDADTGTVIDATPLVPGDKDTHTFTIVAGLDAGHTGDWFYHCHIDYDASNAAMWGVLRVHP